MNETFAREHTGTVGFDRLTGELSGADMLERLAVRALQIGSVVTAPFGHRGYSLGCRAVSRVVATKDIVVALNDDALFAIPLADGYWSRILNERHHYEAEIEALLLSSAPYSYTFVDCGANFGYWSILASSRPFGRQRAIAIEASPRNARRLESNALLNGGRFPCVNAAIGGAPGYARIVGHKHEALAAVASVEGDPDAVRIIPLDALLGEGAIDGSLPLLIKLDVEGLEIEALKGAAGLLALDAVVVCEEHGSDRRHSVARHLLERTKLKVFVFDPGSRRFVAMTSTAVLDRIKRHRWVGYNVFATSSDFWMQRLGAAAWKEP